MRRRLYTVGRRYEVMSRVADAADSRCCSPRRAACASDGKSGERGIAPPTRIPDPVEAVAAPTGQQVSTTAIPREVRRAVVADAAKRFNVAESAVVLTRAEQLTWPDGSLGCPQPGRMYTQMLVAGLSRRGEDHRGRADVSHRWPRQRRHLRRRHCRAAPRGRGARGRSHPQRATRAPPPQTPDR